MPQELPEPLALQEPMVFKVQPVLQVLKAQQVWMVPQELPELTEQLALKVRKELPVLLVHKVLRV